MDLEVAIESVYGAFSDSKKPELVDGCPCCMTADQYEALTAKPLRELTDGELSEYASDVMLTMGREDDYTYFLPRILELSIEDSADWITSIEITAHKMRIAGFEGWSEKRRSTIRNLWLANIRRMAASEFLSFEIDSWLGAATLIPIPVAPLLGVLENAPDVIRELYNRNFHTLFQGRLDNAFLQEQTDGQAEIAHWLLDRVRSSMK